MQFTKWVQAALLLGVASCGDAGESQPDPATTLQQQSRAAGERGAHRGDSERGSGQRRAEGPRKLRDARDEVKRRRDHRRPRHLRPDGTPTVPEAPGSMQPEAPAGGLPPAGGPSTPPAATSPVDPSLPSGDGNTGTSPGADPGVGFPPTSGDPNEVCTTGQVNCGYGCVDPSSSAEHCGGCSYYPSYPSVGQGGFPIPEGDGTQDPAACPSGYQACGAFCIYVAGDSLNCGACGNACAAGEGCSAGACVPLCAEGSTYCNGTCVPGEECGESCAYNASCEDGSCVCGDGLSLCSYEDPSYSYSYCSDFQTDPSNCGGCNNYCGLGSECVAGSCEAIDCGDLFTLCGSTCVDTQSDQYACGGCTPSYGADYLGTPDACGPGQVYCNGYCVNGDTCGSECAYNGSCQQGSCGCEAGLTACTITEFSYGYSLCTDTSADRSHCGACGNNCASGMECVAGECEAISCAPGQILCGTSCVDALSDPYSCGGCTPYSGFDPSTDGQGTGGSTGGVTMPAPGNPGAMPVPTTPDGMPSAPPGMSIPATPPSDMVATSTDPVAVDPTSPMQGSGGMSAVGPEPVPTTPGVGIPLPGPIDGGYFPPLVCSIDGVTGEAACCPYYQADVCGGGCTQLAYDSQNCGACGNTCGADQYCDQGACQAVCQPGSTYCDGYCVEGSGCGQVCFSGSCEQGACACPQGQAVCDNGFGGLFVQCFDLQSDRYNCGGCNVYCDSGTQCVAGSCEPCAGGVCPDEMFPVRPDDGTVPGTTPPATGGGSATPVAPPMSAPPTSVP